MVFDAYQGYKNSASQSHKLWQLTSILAQKPSLLLKKVILYVISDFNLHFTGKIMHD